MELGVLGPLFLRADQKITAPSAPKLRKVFALLVVHGNQVVPVSSLMRELWDDDPPISWLTTLQTYILNLRKMLASVLGVPAKTVSRDILITRSGGYLFRMDNVDLDIERYQVLVSAGREALARGDDGVAVRKLDDALRLWRGPAFVDVPTGCILESKRLQYEESRLLVLEYLVDAELRRGMYREVLTDLVALTIENPLHEGLHAQYMRALYFNDRRAQALEVFRRLRHNLVAELGIEPGPAVQRLHEAILNSDTDLDAQTRIKGSQDIARTAVRRPARSY